MAKLPGDDQTGGGEPIVLRYDGRRLVPIVRPLMPESTVSISVNNSPFSTLIASPHDLHYLVAGFLRMQGVIWAPSDLLSLSVAERKNAVSVRVRDKVAAHSHPPGALWKEQRMVLRSRLSERAVRAPSSGPFFRPEAIFLTMGLLARAENENRRNSEICQAAAGDGNRLLLYAEDIGRHNAVDRIAGEALLKGVDLSGKIMAISGRVSSGLAGKAGFLGVSMIISRVPPTDAAIQVCEDLGITLIGCVRGDKFNVYSHSIRVITERSFGKIAGVTGAILAGGQSPMMGCDKALLPYREGRFIEAIYRKMADLFDEVIVVGADAERYDFIPCRCVPDRFQGMGSLAGIHSALYHSRTERVFVVACDMPYIKGDLIRFLCAFSDESDVVAPEGGKGLEALYAMYNKSALPAVEDALRAGRREGCSFYEEVRVLRVPKEMVERIDPGLSAFSNINTPEDYFRFRREGGFPRG
ncbi:MAG: formate dehydrogenase accessory sulfurtransferase FdhD [Syntrophorhabdaceae bacterium]|nr:formate dehydrogenase accessory sulfurtransferase FdhD [Syntrophorhabdaceae bacterium]